MSGLRVVDRTNLKGEFDFAIEFGDQTPEFPEPSIFTALTEQLGLKLESVKAPTETLVIDHAERPSEN